MRDKESEIIKYLIENKNEELNILKISVGTKIDYKNCHLIIKRLEKALLIKIEKFGQSSRIKLNIQIHPLVIEAEFERRKTALNDKNLAVTLNNFKRTIKSKSYILLLFGSCAKKTNTKGSDIDLMFICPNSSEDSFEKEVNRVVNTTHIPLHTLVFSESQFMEMMNAKESNVGQEALKNNVILYNIEQYYEMISSDR